jgi:hypothetical protein
MPHKIEVFSTDRPPCNTVMDEIEADTFTAEVTPKSASFFSAL